MMRKVRYQGFPTQVDPKDPSSTLDYVIDWTQWLKQDSIILSTWQVSNGVTKVNEKYDAKTATIWLSGGVVGQKYEVTNEITTAAGRTAQRTLVLPIQEM